MLTPHDPVFVEIPITRVIEPCATLCTELEFGIAKPLNLVHKTCVQSAKWMIRKLLETLNRI